MLLHVIKTISENETNTEPTKYITGVILNSGSWKTQEKLLVKEELKATGENNKSLARDQGIEKYW